MQAKKIKPVIYGGGLDLVTPPLLVEPGKLLAAKNFECDVNQGYRAMEGYERVDGRASPVRTQWDAIAVADSTGFVIGEILSGSTSGATAVVLSVSAAGLYLVDVVGTFQDAETLVTSSATTTATSTTFINVTLDDADIYNQIRYLKEIYYRDLIGTVPGIGDIRGVHRHLDRLFAFRDFDGVECRLYEATAGGWQVVPFGHIIFFGSRTNKPPTESFTVSDGNGNTAIASAVIYTTIAEEEGYIIVNGLTAGFAAGDFIKQGTTTLATITIDAAQIVQKAGGRYEMFSYNFFGIVDRHDFYGCDGVNPAFAFDVDLSSFVPIYTDQQNQDIDIPNHIATYKNQLFVGFARGIMRNSEPNDPYLWDAAAGSLEIGIGSEVTGFDATPKSLTILTRRITHALTGSIAENFVLDVSSAQTGAVPFTIQHLGTTFMLDDRGIIELRRVEAFGNFEGATVSRLIAPLIKVLRSTIVASTISRTKNVYRLITSSGRGISMTLQEGAVIGFSEFDVERGVTCTSNTEDELGEERIYFGASDGFVYEWDIGQSHDGDTKETWLKPANHFLGSPTVLKRFYRMYVDSVIEGTATMSISAELSLGTPLKRPTLTQDEAFTGINSAWDAGQWDRALFDTRISSDVHVELTGSGDSISVVYYNTSATDDSIILKDVVYHYKPRRALRGSR